MSFTFASGAPADPCPELQEEIVVRAGFGAEPDRFGDTDWRVDDVHPRPSPLFEGEDGTLYVMDYVKGEIKAFSPEGAWIRNIPVPGRGRFLADFVVTGDKLIWFVETDAVLWTEIGASKAERLEISPSIRLQHPFSLQRSNEPLPPNAYANVGGQLHLEVDAGLVTLVNVNSGMVHPIFDSAGPVPVTRQMAEAQYGQPCGETRVCALRVEDRERGLPRGATVEVDALGGFLRTVYRGGSASDVRNGRIRYVDSIRDLDWNCYGRMKLIDRYSPGPSHAHRSWLSRSGEFIWEIYMTREKQFVISRWVAPEGGRR
jgi:hypothetical protein